MSTLLEMIADAKGAGPQYPCPRAEVTPDAWTFARRNLVQGTWTMMGMWAEPCSVHLALFDPADNALGVMSFEARNGTYPSIGVEHLPARRFERAISDLYGLTAEGAPDQRPWLDHGKWGLRAPLGQLRRSGAADPYEFLPVEGENLHEIPVGPVHAGIIEPGHFRFTASGETVVRLEERLGYVHKGIESLMTGAPIDKARRLAARASGDSTVAYSIAFAQAAEAACDAQVPTRATYLRALMLELERIANHLGDIGAICNDAAFVLMHAHCGVLREQVLRATDSAFGHRLMMDRVVPGGVANDINKGGCKAIKRLVGQIRHRLPALVTLYEDTSSLQDRTVGTGRLGPELAAQFGAGGFVGRASGRAFDARKLFSQPPYDALAFDVPVFQKGDVDARVLVRFFEIEQSLSLIERILVEMPDGAVVALLAFRTAEGVALVEGFRGDIFAWVRIGVDGVIVHAHLRDPSWFQWPLLEAVIENNIVADFPLCNKSFNCSYAGHDL
jgi:Ni,Fe-hydrogenase III large subunit